MKPEVTPESRKELQNLMDSVMSEEEVRKALEKEPSPDPRKLLQEALLREKSQG